MAYTIDSLTEETLLRLGDRKARSWSRAEIKNYLVEGYNALCYMARPLWDVTIFNDKPPFGTYDFAFEPHYMSAQQVQASISFEFERLYVQQNPQGRAGMSFAFELAYTDGTPAAVSQLPKEMLQVERAAWSGRRIMAMSSNGMEWGLDSQYETTTGDVEAYILDKDGNYSFRRYRVPAGNGSYFEYVGNRGTIRNIGTGTTDTLLPLPRLGWWARMTDATTIWPPDHSISLSLLWSFIQPVVVSVMTSVRAFTGTIVSPTRGVIRRIPGFHPTKGTRGIIRAIYLDHRNTRVEYHRRGLDPRVCRYFELPDFYVRYARHYAMSKAYRRDGDHQDIRLSKHYDKRFKVGVQRMQTRLAANGRGERHELGSNKLPQGGRPPLARLPWNYPERGARRRRRY